jgi:hypothetical protein
MLRDRCWLLVVLALACGRDDPAPPPARVPAPALATPAEIAALTEAIEPRLAPPPGGWHALRDTRGRDRIRLGGRFQGMTLATQAADGSLRVQCVSSAAEARAFLGAAGPAEAPRR